MKRFNCFFLVFALLFFAACGDGVERIVPETEKEGKSDEKNNEDDGNSVIDDDDASDSSVEPSAPDTDPDSDTADTSDDGDAADSGDDSDSDDDMDSGDDSDPGDDSDSDDDSDDSADSGDDSDMTPDPADSGTEDDSCYAAVFNGTDSKIEVKHNDLLDLNSEAWTIEAWVKQTPKDEYSANAAPIVGKINRINNNSYTYTYLLSYYYTKTSGGNGGWNGGQQTKTTAMKGTASYGFISASAEATNLANSGDWTHIALVQTITNALMNTKSPQVTLYIDGKKVKSSDSNSSASSLSITTSEENLIIGQSFDGMIDSIRISSTAKYSEDFAPKALKADNDTIALWNFSNNADDSSGHGLNGISESIQSITYVKECRN